MHYPSVIDDEGASERNQGRVCKARGDRVGSPSVRLVLASSILVFWNTSEINPARIAEMKDIDRLQDSGYHKIVYSRVITPVGKSSIMKYYAGFGGPKPPPIDHLGIDDAFSGKASVVNYFYRGNWLQFAGERTEQTRDSLGFMPFSALPGDLCQ